MSEFKIKVSVELDSSDLESKLKALGKEQEIELKLNTDKIESQLNSLKKSFKDTFKLDGQVINDLNKISKALDKFNKSTTPTSPSGGKSTVSNLVKEYKELANVYDKLQKQMTSGKLGTDSIERTKNQLNDLKNKMDELKNKAEGMDLSKIELFDSSRTNKAMVDMNSYLNKIETQASSLQNKLKSVSFDHIDMGKIDLISAKLEEIQAKAREGINLDFEDIGNILNDLSKLSTVINDLTKVENLASSFERISGSISDTNGDVERFQNTLKDLENSATKLDGSFDRAFSGANNELKEMNSNARRVSNETRSLGRGLLGTWDDFKGNFAQFTLAEIAGDFITDGIRTLARGIKDTVVETDSAITDLNKVYDQGLKGDNLRQYLDKFTEVAKQSGKSSVDVIQGTAKAVQMGVKDIDDALVFARQSAIFSNVGDVGQEQADTYLSAIMSAYGGVENSLKPVREEIVGAGKDYNTLTKFMDLANYAGNKFAVSTADIGEALSRSSSALQTNGNSMQESVAMATAMNEVLQDASRTGTSLKSISAGLSGIQVSAKTGQIELTKAGKALKEYANIDVWNKQTGEVKSMYDTMDELATKWDGLSEAQQMALGTAIAGKTQLNSFNALLSNWDTARKYMQDYKDGLMVGSAEKENAQYVDSIAGKWNQVKENMKSVANEIVTSDMAKVGLDSLVGLTNGLDTVTRAWKDGMSSIFEGTVDKDISNSLFQGLEKMFGGFGDTGNKIATVFSDTIGKAFENLANFGLSQSPILNGMVKAYRKLNEEARLNNEIEESKVKIDGLNEEIRAIDNKKKAVGEIAEEYNKLNEKEKRSASENQRLLELKEQLIGIDDELVLGYDKDGNAILKNLKMQNAEYERQIALKNQSRRVEENSLANDVTERRLKNQKDYNKAMEEYNQMQLASDTDRKQGLFGDESTSDYYKRIVENNKKLAEENAKAYEQRLADHVQYVEDERAIQERYINQMENADSFGKMAEEQQRGMLQFMDALDWSQFSIGEGTQLTQQLSQLGDKFVETTDKMGKHAKKINELEDSYATGGKSLVDYTKGLGDVYEASKKIDGESFSNWRQGVQSFVDTTGDLETANKAINEMATSLNKVTGISTDTWKTALSFDPAPVDASNQALQKFMKTYGETTANIGKTDFANKLQSQFETLQTSYMQITDDLAGGKEIDVEYLVNAKVNQPEPISKLIDEIIADGEVETHEIDLLIEAQAEILNTGTLSSETISKIAETFNMTEEEVIAKFNVKAEVGKTDTSAIKEVSKEWDEIETGEKVLSLMASVIGGDVIGAFTKTWDLISPNEKKTQSLEQKATGGDLLQKAKSTWDSMNVGEKVQSLVQKATGSDLIQKAKTAWDGMNVGEKVQSLVQKATGSDLIQKAKSTWEGMSTGEKIQTLVQKATGGNIFATAKATWDSLGVGEKVQSLIQKATGKEEVESASKTIESLPSTKEITVSIIQSGANLLDSVANWFNSKAEQNVEIKAKVGKVDTSALDGIKAKDIDIKAKVGEVDTSALNNITAEDIDIKAKVGEVDTSALNNITAEDIDIKAKVGEVDTSALDGIKAKDIDIKAKVGEVDTSALDNIKAKDVDIKAKVGKVDTSALDGIKSKDVEVSAKVTGIDQVNSLKSTLSSLQNKAISITVGGNALGQVNQVKSALTGIQSKSISITASGNALGQINTIKSSLNGLQSKAISISASVNGTNQVNALKVAIAGLQGKSVSVTASTSGTDGVNALTSAIGRVQGKSVSVTANVSGTSAVNALTSAINRVKSKSVKVSASVSGTGAVQSLASAIASVRSKTVSVRVNKTISTTTQSVGGSSVGYATPSDVSLANIPVTSSDSVNISSPTPMVTSFASSSSGISLSKILPSINFDIDIFKNLEESLSKLESQLNVIDKRMNLAFGDEKIKLLQQQIPLLKQQQAIQEKIIQREREENGQLTSWLKSQGFKFDNLGNITNYVDKLLAMETNVENLKKKYDDLNDAKKKDENATKNAQKAYENANKTLDTAKKYLQEYFDTNSDNVNEAVAKWTEYQIAIEETKQKIREYERELKALTTDSRRKDNERDIAMVENRLELIKAQIEGAKDEKEKNALMQTRIKLTEQLKKETSDLLEYEQRYKNEIMKELNQYGFKFRQDGSIEGYGTKIQELKKTLSEVEFDYVFEKVEEYLEQTQSVIPELIIDLQELQNEIQDVNKDIEKTIKELKGLREDSRYKDNERDIAMVENLLKMNQALIDQTNGSTEEISLLQERINLTRRLQKENNDLLAYEEERRKMLMSDLSSYGFTFRDDGSMAGYGSIIENLKKTLEEEEFDEVFAKVEDYLKTTIETIPSLQIEFEELNADIEETAKKIRDFEKEIKELREDSRYKDNERDISEVENLLKLNQALIDQADGSSKEVSLLQERISLTRRLQKENNDLLAYEEERRKMLMSDLGSYGFTFRTDGSMIGYGGIIEELKRTLSEEEFDEVFKNVEDYLETTFQTIPDLQTEFENLNGEIEEMEDEVRELARQQELFASTNTITELTNQYEELSHTLGLIEEQMKYAYGVDKLKLMEESVEIINKQLDVQLEKLKQTEDQMAIYQRELDDYGFTFDEKGNIKNYKDIMEFYRSSDDVEDLLNITQEYFDLQSELKDITSDYASLGNQIKDIYKDQLEITQQIEGEITDIITKEFEERKKEAEEYAEEYANTRIKMLEEERKAYQAMRDAQDYDESVEDQLKEIEVLRKQIETAKRDTSISGQKRLSELTKELAEAEKRLADITQEQIDKDFDSNITDEIDKIESEKEQILDALEKEFDEKLSEENIAKIVQEALSSGFIELNGEIQSIQSLLLNSINESADGYSAMAEVIKNELVANLNIALDTMRELENINSTLGLQSFDIANSVSTTPINTPEHSSNSGNNITIGDTNITVTGSVDDITLTKIEEMIQDSQDKMLNEITANL